MLDHSPDRAAAAFNDAINRRDLDALGELMTEGHTFIDSEGNVFSGKDDVLNAWQHFFDAFPDYRNDWLKLRCVGTVLIAVGRSVCSTEPTLDGPAIWTAITADDKVSEWRVYEDTPAKPTPLGTRAGAGLARKRRVAHGMASEPGAAGPPAVGVRP